MHSIAKCKVQNENSKIMKNKFSERLLNFAEKTVSNFNFYNLQFALNIQENLDVVCLLNIYDHGS